MKNGLLLGVAALLAWTGLAETKTVDMMPSEHWWGVMNYYGTQMPFDAATDLEMDVRKSNMSNQAASFLVSDKGRFLWCDEQTKVTIRGGKITMEADAAPVELDVSGKTLKEAYLAASAKHFPPCGKTPDLLFFSAPQYNTWIELTYHQNEKDILAYARSMLDNGLPPGVLMIDDTWQAGYGDWRFEPTRFADPKGMMDKLRAMGYKVILWMCPHVSMDTPAYRRLAWGTNPDDVKGYPTCGGFLGVKGGKVHPRSKAVEPAAIGWWNGKSAFLDFTHPNANAWFREQLDRLVKDYGAEGFKFDGGHFQFYAQGCETYKKGASSGEQVMEYAKFALEYPVTEYRNAWRFQSQPVVERLHDKDHTWEALRKLVPDMIAGGLLGHQFMCPDMVGGGSWTAFLPGAPFDPDLFVRSAQVHALCGMMQFSASPWRYLDPARQQIVRDVVKMRQEKFAGFFVELAKEAGRTAEPMIRNLEYNYPGRGYANVRDQFMMGHTLLVAPVVEKDAKTRKVVLPPGRWLADDGKAYDGPATVEVDAPLARLPFFTLCPAGGTPGGDIVIENARLRLVAGSDAKVKSLVLKATGEECVPGSEGIPLFSVTQDRPFNNEIKLIHSHKRTTYPANALRREGDRLVVGFRIAPYEAAVDLKVTDSYVEFRLADFIVDKEDYDYLKMDVPPVASFRVLQLPVLNRRNFGDWLNASWDEKSAIGVVGTSPYADIDHEDRNGFRILTADLVRGQKLKGASAALVAANGREDFLDCMDRLEEDFDLPRGVKSRRSDAVNAFIYHVSGDPARGNVDDHIAWARRGGFKYMTFRTENFTKGAGSWGLHGDYDWRDEYPNGAEDVRKLLAKVKAAGIHPGLHFLHTHIGLMSRYVTPVADPRLNKTRRFTLAKPLDASTNETEITVFEPTEGVTTFEPCRVLQFGGELVSYESYTTTPPYRFLGVRRGVHKTTVTAHPHGQVGGILDISEYGKPLSCYVDQNTDLQDEVSAKIAALYDCGFEYAYFDGSEGVNAPCNFHVSNAQYRQWKLFKEKPLFSEGAAKSHFDWHILSGANAFDCFSPKVFKRNIVRFPVAQAPLSWQDMTRVNFGWWGYFPEGERDWWDKASAGTKPDHWQFACSQCLAWDCPATVNVDLARVARSRKNAEACFEVMRLWEEARSRKLLTREQKLMLRDASREWHLSIVDGRAVLTEVPPTGH